MVNTYLIGLLRRSLNDVCGVQVPSSFVHISSLLWLICSLRNPHDNGQGWAVSSLISEGWFLSTGNCGDINLVRLGPERSINNEVLRFSLDNQVNHRMSKYWVPFMLMLAHFLLCSGQWLGHWRERETLEILWLWQLVFLFFLFF